jgi:hypothetical protein
MVVGAVYRWDLTSAGYGRWTRVIAAVALMAIAVVSVWDYRDEPGVVAAAIVVGAALASAFVWAHRALSARLQHPGEHSVPPESGD